MKRGWILICAAATLLSACGGPSGWTRGTGLEDHFAETETETEGGTADKAESLPAASEEKAESETEPIPAAPEAEAEPETETETEVEQELLLGDEQFELYLPLVEGKRVALLTNQGGVVGDDPDLNILDALYEKGVDLTVVFSPEHGFRGTADAGETVENDTDPVTGVPLVSLYGNGSTNPPESADLDRFDVVLVDLPDVGLRYFTYYISLLYMMDSCAASGKEVIVLDRPNPNGYFVDGPILEDYYYSGVGKLPIPIVHGLTFGELAQMINGEGWLSAGANACDLTVIPCKNYDHNTEYSFAVRPSPNLKDDHAILLYPSTCYFENTVCSVGRGTEKPFNIFGSPYLQGAEGYDFSFTPVPLEGAMEPPFEGETCYGRDLSGVPAEEIREKGIDLTYLIDAYHALKELHPEVSFFGKSSNERYFADLLFGTDRVRRMIEEGCSAEEVEASWQEDVEAFRIQRRPYLLYPE